MKPQWLVLMAVSLQMSIVNFRKTIINVICNEDLATYLNIPLQTANERLIST